MNKQVVAILALLVSASVASDAQAEGYRERVRFAENNHLEPPPGWYLGFGAHGTAFVRQTGGPEVLQRGAGASLFGGFHLVPRATLEFGWTESFHNAADIETGFGTQVDYLVLDSWTIGSRVYLRGMASDVSPYLQVGLGLYALSSEYFGLESSGTGFHIGIGSDIWLNDFLTIGGRIRYRSIALGPPSANYDDTFLTTTLLEVGIGFHY